MKCWDRSKRNDFDFLEVISIEKCTDVFITMQGFDKPWAIAGGWSIDLFLDDVSREHDDIEIALFRNDQIAVREYLVGWNFMKVSKGNVESWELGESLVSPIHEMYAEKVNEKIEILLNESDGEHWIYRRDTRIRRELSKIIMATKYGVPFLSPEITLLYKSKSLRPKDKMDFIITYPHMDFEQKNWFQESLKLIYVEHPWIEGFN
jgi:hypothetical protein